MNIEICKKCHLYPHLLKLEDPWNGERKLIVCTNYFKASRALTIAELDEDNFNKIIDYLVENDNYDKNNAYKTEAISLQDRIKKDDVLKDIEINQDCPYYFEQEMERLNE